MKSPQMTPKWALLGPKTEKCQKKRHFPKNTKKQAFTPENRKMQKKTAFSKKRCFRPKTRKKPKNAKNNGVFEKTGIFPKNTENSEKNRKNGKNPVLPRKTRKNTKKPEKIDAPFSPYFPPKTAEKRETVGYPLRSSKNAPKTAPGSPSKRMHKFAPKQALLRA